MKIKLPIAGCRLPLVKKTAVSASVLPTQTAADFQPSTFNLQPAQRGVALVITLILLSVTLIMALALLALANRERNSVNTTTDTAQARLAADSALAAAQAQIIANVFTTNNGALNFGLLVSTNYITVDNNYFDGAGDGNGPLFTGGLFIGAATNQQILPRAPVFLTNALTGTTDFRFYLDLNRNGVFDASGTVTNYDETGVANGVINEIGDPEWIGVLARPDAPYSANNPFIQRYAFFALPIGNGLDLNAIHNESYSGAVNIGPNNIIPTDGFLRNQGVGSWEINLAAFLTDLNTNQWDLTASSYTYNPPPSAGGNSGAAFDDARSLLSYRYDFGYTNQAKLGALSAGAGVLQNNYPADLFPFGALVTNTTVSLFGNNTNLAWAGSANTNRFFDLMSDLYDTSKVSTNFINRLTAAGTNTVAGIVPTYDRYTFYRMLSQLGTDSDPDAGKMNLNYSNVLVTYSNSLPVSITVIPGAETNLVSWTATNFFIAAANRMLLNYSANWFASSPSNYLRTYYGATNYNYYHYDAAGNYITNDPTGFGLTNTPVFGNNNQLPFAFTNGIPAFGITNIPVYVNGQFVYTPAVNRVLQLAANLYDASTNYYFPSVFRPVFYRDIYGNVFIAGYQQVVSVTGTNDVQLAVPTNAVALTTGPAGYIYNQNIYDVPWIIGAKKGFPNFNNFSERNQMQVIRRIQLTRDANSVLATNQMYMLNLQSSLGMDFWNSYVSNFYDTATVVFQGRVDMGLTNDDGTNFSANEAALLNSSYYMNGGLTNVGNGGIGYPGNGGLGYTYGFSTATTLWPGSSLPSYSPSSPYPGSFITWSNTVSVLPYSVYRTSSASSGDAAGFGTPCLVPANWLYSAASPNGQLVYETNGAGSLANYQLPNFGLQTTNRFQAYIIDSFGGINHIIDYVQISQENSFNLNTNIFINNPASVWSTNVSVASGISAGVSNQIANSIYGTSAAIDNQSWNTTDATTSRDGFRSFLTGATNQIQAGYTPICTADGYVVFSANDPLVHYTAGDLTPSGLVLPGRVPGLSVDSTTISTLGVGGLNPNYGPWGLGLTKNTTPIFTTQAQYLISSNTFAFWLKDPLAYSSTNWDFPTNKYPSVGWIGRVHRGTPWQTVYLKSTDVLNDFGSDNAAYNDQEINNGQLLWLNWSGDQNLYDSGNSAPAFDWQLFDLFTTALNDNATRGTLSVNVGANGSPSLAAWSAVLSGVAVPTSTTNSYAIINPAGVAGTNSALWQIVNNINATRATFTNNPDGVVGTFEHVGDVLRTPYLTEGLSSVSPFLAGMNTNYINDEVYEALPQQIMGLLRVSSTPRYVIYGYGQTLRPAPHGKVLENNENEFGLVTNYQVVAESAVRAVVSVQTNIVVTPTGFQTNYTTKLESYNVLPPD